MKQALWKAYCSFSKKERQGVVVLLILTGICVAMPTLWEQHISPARVYSDDSTFREEVTAFREALAQEANSIPTSDSVRKDARRFYFDPNTITAAEWLELGVAPKQVSTIQHYLAKGGQFRRKEDLQRIYGLSAALCSQLMPYVRFAARVPSNSRIATQKPSVWDTLYARRTHTFPAVIDRTRKTNPSIDINTADSAQWESLPGIGPLLAARIIKFRDRLGGFYSIHQIGETFGLPDTTFNKIQPYLQLHKVSLKKIDINHVDEKSLAQHPYIRYKLARLIILYRNSHGPFRESTDLLGIPLVDDSIYRKIEHYIKTENSPLL